MSDNTTTLTADLTGIALVSDIELKLKSAMAAGNLQLCVELSTQLTKARKGAADELAKVADSKFIDMGTALLDTAIQDIIAEYDNPETVTLSDIVLTYFEQAEEIVGDRANFALRFSRDFTKPYVGFVKVKADHPKSIKEAKEKTEPTDRVSSTSLLALFGETEITKEMAGSKYISDYIGQTFQEATELITSGQKDGTIKDGNPKYQLKLAMQRLQG